MSTPLHGKTVLLTRAFHQSKAMKASVEALGGHGVIAPLLQFRPCQLSKVDWTRLKQINDYDYIIFTSVNTVIFLLDCLTEINININGPRIAAVGPVTARYLEDNQLTPDILPTSFHAIALAQQLKQENKNQSRNFLLPQSRLGKRDIIDTLEADGHLVDRVALYTTEKNDVGCDELLAFTNQNTYDAVTFTSPSTVEIFVSSLTSEQLQNVKENKTIGCIGRSTAEMANQHGFKNLVVPKTFTSQALIEALAEYYEEENQ